VAITCEHLGALELIMAIAITVAITCEHLGALELEERRAAYAELEHLQQRQSMAISAD
jgi:hypothetical protein